MATQYDPDKHHRRSIRLQEYDYGTIGAYFVTICTHQRKCTLGFVGEETMHTNAYGRIVEECWTAIPTHFPHVELDAFVIMPNHMHGIVIIHNSVGATHASPLRSGPQSGGLGAIIGSFKSAVTRRNNMLHDTSAPFWQRNYYEHVIRNADDLNHIRNYIEQNPARWLHDRLHSS